MCSLITASQDPNDACAGPMSVNERVSQGYLELTMTRTELAERLTQEGFRSSSQSRGNAPSYEGLVLSNVHGNWLIQFFERGRSREIGRFVSEDEACNRFYEIVSSDPTYRQ